MFLSLEKPKYQVFFSKSIEKLVELTKEKQFINGLKFLLKKKTVKYNLILFI